MLVTWLHSLCENLSSRSVHITYIRDLLRNSKGREDNRNTYVYRKCF